MLRPYARWGYLIVAWLFVACAVIQVFLAGLAVFSVPAGDFATHRMWGYTFSWSLLALLILAIAGKLSRREIGLTVLLIVQFGLQSVLVGLKADYPALAALHPVNVFALLLVAIYLAHGARRFRRTDSSA